MTARRPRQTGNFADPQVNELARDTIEAFKLIHDCVYIDADVVVSSPLALMLRPRLPDGTARTQEPQEVRCHRARVVGSSIAMVAPGGTSWDWIDGAVRINSVAGLTVGTRYRLGFAVVG
jgi:hypothetical protein